jgi:hypothetical protein
MLGGNIIHEFLKKINHCLTPESMLNLSRFCVFLPEPDIFVGQVPGNFPGCALATGLSASHS